MNHKKILKFIVAIIILILIVVVIFITRRYIIINQIIGRCTEIEGLNNYSFVAKQNKNGQETIIEYKHKDDKMTAKIGERIFWYDNSTDENISCSPEDLTATISTGNGGLSVESLINTLEKPFKTDNTFLNKLKLAIMLHISSEEINGEKCYAVSGTIESSTYYYRANDKNILRLMTEDGKNVWNYEWSFDKVSDEDVARPNLEGYHVKNNQ